jgi:hypothetical protein
MQCRAPRSIPRRLFVCADLSVVYPALRNWNNTHRDVLMSDQPTSEQAGARSRHNKNKSEEETMPTLAKIFSRVCFGLGAAWLAALAAQPAQAQTADTSFFITSVGIGTGGNLGGLAGADNYCQTLAQAAGAGGQTWRAYLSTQQADGKPAVNARDRIGKGPWQNSKGTVVAKDVTELHSGNNINKQTALTEKGEIVNGFGDQPNRHDILTGSQPDGTAFAAGDDRTCKNWTSSTQGAAMLGRSDLSGPATNPTAKSWNAAHPSGGPEGGCSQKDLVSTGGAGLLYCFAAN